MGNRMLRDWTVSERVNKLSPFAERFFTRLIMKADDYGCYYADLRLLHAHLFPLMADNITQEEISSWIIECEKVGIVKTYESSGKRYLQIIDFGQRLDRARAKFPLPEGDDTPSGGYVYLMGENLEAAVLKIGFSVNPWARVKEVTKISGKPVVVLMTLKGTISEEQEIHRLLREYNESGEWFNLPKAVIELFSKHCEDKKTATDLIVVLRSSTVVLRSPPEVEENTNTKEKPKTETEGEKKPPPQILEKPLDDDRYEVYEEWTNLILEERDQFFTQMLFKEKIEFSAAATKGHLELVARYDWKFNSQQKFRTSVIKHHKEFFEKQKREAVGGKFQPPPTATVYKPQITSPVNGNEGPTPEELAEAKRLMEIMIDNDFTSFCENENCAIKYPVREIEYLIENRIYRPTVEQVQGYKLQAIEIRKKQLNATYDPLNRITLSHYMSGLLPQGDTANLVTIAKDLALREYFRKKREEEFSEPVEYPTPQESFEANIEST